MKRVVITGLGVITALGNTPDELCKSLEKGDCAVRYIPDWEEYPELHSKVAAPVELSDAQQRSIPRIKRRSMGKLSKYAALASESAAQDAGLSEGDLSSGRVGCVIGSTMGSADALVNGITSFIYNKQLPDRASMSFFQSMSNTAVMNTSIYLGITGMTIAPSAACASSLQAIGIGRDLIATSQQDVVLCGGAEQVHAGVTGCFDVLFATSTNHNDHPELASRPFHAERDGIVVGGGAGVVVLEEYERAKKRGAQIYAEIVGYATCASGIHVSQSDERAISKCLALALSGSNTEIGYVSCHGTATVHGDASEIAAVKKLLGENIPLSSLKGNLGHTLGASGSIELVASLLMMREGVLYPTLRLDKVADDCAYASHVTQLREYKFDAFIKNCFAFGGINASLVCKKV